MENDSWLIKYLQAAQEEAAAFPKWTREVPNTVDNYYGRNAPSGPAVVTQACEECETVDDHRAELRQ